MIKVGDTVVRTGGCYRGMLIGDKDTVVGLRGNADHYDVTLLKFGPGHSPNSLRVINNDPLPPVERHVMYNQGHGNRLSLTLLEANQWHPARIRVDLPGVCTVLTPDDALNLCHDLRRMAMEIKRQEKADD